MRARLRRFLCALGGHALVDMLGEPSDYDFWICASCDVVVFQKKAWR